MERKGANLCLKIEFSDGLGGAELLTFEGTVKS